MKKSYLLLALLFVPYFLKSQCSKAPTITQGFNEIQVCEASENKETYLFFNFADQEPVDSIGVILYRYLDSDRVDYVSESPFKEHEGRSVYLDLNQTNLGFGIIAACVAINECGTSDTAWVDIPIYKSFKTPDCKPDYASRIVGNTQIDLQDNSPQAYVLDSPELSSYFKENVIDSGFIYLQWEVKQFEGGNFTYYESENVSSTGYYSDSTVIVPGIPEGKSHVIFKVFTLCHCSDSSGMSSFVIDTLVVEKADFANNPSAITGYVYATDGSDCSNTDNPMAKQIVKIDPIGQYAATDSNGYYFAPVEPGDYTVSLFSKAGTACQPSGTNVSVAANESVSADIFQKFTEANAALHGWGRATMQNSRFTQTISLKNLGKPLVGDLNYSIEQIRGQDPVKLANAAPAPTTLNTTSAEWTNHALTYYQEDRFHLDGTLENVVMGDTICVNISYSTADSTFEAKVKILVRNSYDPNDKQVSETELIWEEIQGKAIKLDYRIRFQNTGNDTAYNITVTDTLPFELDINTLELGASSHNFEFSLSDNQTIVWTFNNIMLPDSGTDLEGSNGFILFSIYTKPNLALGDSILNRANIYFDQNEPVITNAALTAVTEKQTTGISEYGNTEFSVYPNPSSGQVNFSSNKHIKSVAIYQLDGRLVLKQKVDHTNGMVDLSTEKPGIYLMIVTDSEANSVKARIIKE